MRNSTFAGEGRQITVNSRKYDGRVRRSWSAGLISGSNSHLVLVGRFDRDVEHTDLGLIREGTVSFEHFWLDRWYNVFRFHEPDGTLKSHYCNIAMPPTFDGEVLDYIDLDIDVIVWPDDRVEVLDHDDFERNRVAFGYPDEVQANARRAVDELTASIAAGELSTLLTNPEY